MSDDYAKFRAQMKQRFDVWMQYPANNQKMPWGLIASGLTAEEAEVFRARMVVKVSIQLREEQ